jgi:hypothetical protein
VSLLTERLLEGVCPADRLDAAAAARGGPGAAHAPHASAASDSGARARGDEASRPAAAGRRSAGGADDAGRTAAKRRRPESEGGGGGELHGLELLTDTAARRGGGGGAGLAADASLWVPLQQRRAWEGLHYINKSNVLRCCAAAQPRRRAAVCAMRGAMSLAGASRCAPCARVGQGACVGCGDVRVVGY